MTVVDARADAQGLEARLRAELVGATWFDLAAATARAHRALRGTGPDDARAEARYAVLQRLLAEATSRVARAGRREHAAPEPAAHPGTPGLPRGSRGQGSVEQSVR